MRARQGRDTPASRPPRGRARRGPPPSPAAPGWGATPACARPTPPTAPSRACCAAPAQRAAPRPQPRPPRALPTEPARRRDSPHAPSRTPHRRRRRHHTGHREPGCVPAWPPAQGLQAPRLQQLASPREAPRFRPPRRPGRCGAAAHTAWRNEPGRKPPSTGQKAGRRDSRPLDGQFPDIACQVFYDHQDGPLPPASMAPLPLPRRPLPRAPVRPCSRGAVLRNSGWIPAGAHHRTWVRKVPCAEPAAARRRARVASEKLENGAAPRCAPQPRRGQRTQSAFLGFHGRTSDSRSRGLLGFP